VGVFDTLRALGRTVLRRLGAEDGTPAGQRANAALRTPVYAPALDAPTGQGVLTGAGVAA
jgi:hypothetical protein